MKTLLEQVEEEELARTEIVHLRLGELKILSKEALSRAYQMITAESLLQGSALEFEDVPVKVCCASCGFSGGVDYDDDAAFHFSTPILSCPRCGGKVEVVQGKELEVRRLTVADEGVGES